MLHAVFARLAALFGELSADFRRPASTLVAAALCTILLLVLGELWDRRLRNRSNREPLRVVHVTTSDALNKICETGYLTCKPTGWGPLAGMGSFRPTAWVIRGSLDDVLHGALLLRLIAFPDIVLSGSPPVGIEFDLPPERRDYRAFSKAWGRIVRIHSDSDRFAISDVQRTSGVPLQPEFATAKRSFYERRWIGWLGTATLFFAFSTAACLCLGDVFGAVQEQMLRLAHSYATR